MLYDDRAGKVSPGVKFKDAELIGVPDDRHRRPRPGRRHRRGPGPRAPASARRSPVADAADHVVRRVVPWRDACIEAVIFDWGGTLTRWHDVDFHAESLALAQAVVNAAPDDDRRRSRRAAARARATSSGGAAATTSRARRSPTSSPRPGSTTTPSC